MNKTELTEFEKELLAEIRKLNTNLEAIIDSLDIVSSSIDGVASSIDQIGEAPPKGTGEILNIIDPKDYGPRKKEELKAKKE